VSGRKQWLACLNSHFIAEDAQGFSIYSADLAKDSNFAGGRALCLLRIVD
jgi:hypothetical protein